MYWSLTHKHVFKSPWSKLHSLCAHLRREDGGRCMWFQLSICTLYLPWFRTSSCLTEVNITATKLDWYINQKSSATATTSTLRGHQIPRSFNYPTGSGRLTLIPREETKELHLHLHRNPCLLGGMEPLRHVKPCKSWDVPSSSSSHRQDYWISVAGSQ